jgi:type IV pilus assembly protein PilM
MGLFSSKKTSFIGIDIGAGNIKVIELQNEKGRPKLTTYGYGEVPLEDQESGSIPEPKRVASVLKKICREARTSSKNTVAALPVASVFSSIINLPKVAKKELASGKNLAPLIHWEAKKLLPLPLEDMVLDWQILEKEMIGEARETAYDGKKVLNGKNPEEEKKGGLEMVHNTRVLITAASKELVQNYVDIFKEVGLQLLNLETDVFALIRSLVGNDRSTLMLVDIGAKTTNVSIIDNTIPYLNKTINIGGIHFTQTMSSSLALGKREAEQLKIDLSRTGKREFPSALSHHMVDVVNEVKYSIQLFTNSQSGKRIEKIILTGGSSLLPSLSEYLSRELGIRVYIGDPWARVMYPEDLRPILDEIGPIFSIAIGLAMRNIR